MSDALKQGALTYAGGRGARYLAGAEGPAGGLDTFSMEGFKKGPVGRLFKGKETNPLSDGFKGAKNTPIGTQKTLNIYDYKNENAKTIT